MKLMAPGQLARQSNPEIEANVNALLERMTLAEKVGQMTQVEKNSIKPGDIARYSIGSILSGGGGYPDPNTPAAWRKMVNGFISESLESRLGIPLIYGSDAVHGHNNVKGATIFPHNIGLGATGNAALVARIARATALEMAATGIRWNFAPAVSLPLDLRWGRSYEGFSQDSAVITKMAAAYVQGLVGDEPHQATLPSVKHFIGDGSATWGSSRRIASADVDLILEDPTLANAKLGEWMIEYLKLGAWKIDQGESLIDEATLRAFHLPPYVAAINAGALNIMVSYSSWDGIKMHGHKYLLTDVLKEELGFAGFLVTDWEGLDQLDDDFYKAVCMCINAGMDMNMVPFRYEAFMETLIHAVNNGDVPMGRIDDAVRRILRVKMIMGLFEQPYCDTPLDVIGNDTHRALAAEAAEQSLVCLKNDGVFPIGNDAGSLIVSGRHGHDIGLQCGGWTIDWMGRPGPITEGTTIFEGIQELARDRMELIYDEEGQFGDIKADIGFVFVGEEPYAEGMGDRADLQLPPEQIDLVRRMRQHCDKVVVILVSGRPLIVTELMEEVDGFVAAWLPGSEGRGVAAALLGDTGPTGTLQYEWPRTMAQIPLGTESEQAPLFAPGDFC